MRVFARAGRGFPRLISVLLAMSMLCAMVPAVAVGGVIDSDPDHWYADPVNGHWTNGGTSPADALDTITAAVELAGPNDTIHLATGVYDDECFPIGLPAYRSPLAFVGAGADQSIIDGGGESQLMSLSEGIFNFEGIAFANGMGSDFELAVRFVGSTEGGAISSIEATASFTDCVFDNNTAQRGGAVGAVFSQVTFDGCTFTENGLFPEDLLPLISEEPPLEGPVVCEEGGAVWAAVSSVDIKDSSFERNEAFYFGSAIASHEGDLSVEGSEFVSNSISRLSEMRDSEATFEDVSGLQVEEIAEGGTITTFYNEEVVLADSKFEDNLAYAGAGLLSFASAAEVTDCDFDDNISVLGPLTFMLEPEFWLGSAGVEPQDVEALPWAPFANVQRCEMRGQIDGWTAAYFSEVPAYVANVLVVDNDGLFAGLGFSECPEATVANVTIANNDAAFAISGFGGDLEPDIILPPESGPQVVNSILWDGEIAPYEGCDVTYSDLYTGSGGYKAGEAGALKGDFNIYEDPLFVAPNAGDYRLVAASPCIDSGTDCECAPDDDLDNLSRPVDGNGDTVEEWDMGAYEYFARDTDRIAGSDRFETSVEISKQHFASSQAVVLATGRTFADGLAASGLAGVFNAPLLLTDTTVIPQSVRDEIGRLGASRAYVTGGTAAISASVAAQLQSMGLSVERIGGRDRYETAAMIAQRIVDEDPGAGELVFIARGDLFADALTASPVAYANHAPILLVKPTQLPKATIDVIETLGAQRIVVLGGSGAVGASVADEVGALDPPTERISGANRYETAANFSVWATENLYARWNVTGVATGMDFADALTGGAGIGTQNGVLLLTPRTAVHAAVDDVLSAYGGDVVHLQLFGGTNAVTESVKNELMSYLP